MKPLKLTISAFASYADEQTIDFTKLGANGLYLIAGETGAGKTTIFDAVSFALFGKASGTGRDEYQKLRSDFARSHAKTYVELTFVSGGTVYHVRRQIKKQGQDVVLTLPDGSALSGKKAVDERIVEAVGLDRSQFAQIVMIAQNDFLRFLQSNTDERLKILRRIFGTEALKQFQERLKEKAREAGEKRGQILYDFARHNVDVYKREEQMDEWECKLQEYEADMAETEAQIIQWDQERRELAAEMAVAAERSKRFEDLLAFRKELKHHGEKEKEMAENERKKSLGETALHKIKPLADEAGRTEKVHQSALSALETANTGEKAALLAEEKAVQSVRLLAPMREAQEAFAGLQKEWDATSGKLSILRELQRKRMDISDKQALLHKAQAEFEEACVAFDKADDQYRQLEEVFLRSQAGVIAAKLTEGEPCPVCGSRTHPTPAVLTGEEVSAAKLKKTRTARDDAQTQREDKSAACGSLRSVITALTEQFVCEASGMIQTGQTASFETIQTVLADLLTQTQAVCGDLDRRKKSEEKALKQLAADWERAARDQAEAEAASQAAKTLVNERAANEQAAAQDKAQAREAYQNALCMNGFADEGAYRDVLLSNEELDGLRRTLLDYEKNGESLIRDIKRLETETAGLLPPDMAGLEAKAKKAEEESIVCKERRDRIKNAFDNMSKALKEVRHAAAELEKTEKSYAAVKQLADTANGKLDFETYAQMAYFERVLRAANKRLKLMSQSRYTLLRKQESADRRSKTGLEIEVFDAYTGKARPANFLSGGESFMASLSLALGLSDVVQQSTGGVQLDAMFIDEGFGSLDTEVLELAVRTLSEMAAAGRIIGIISHVGELRERIDKQIKVEKTTSGSRISLAV